MKLPVLFAMTAGLLCAGDWLSFGGDPARTGFARTEDRITKGNVGKLAIEWKLKLENEPKELNYLTAPIVAEKIFTPQGVKDIVVVAAASDNIFAIDADRGVLMWRKHFSIEGRPKMQPGWLCPAALNATPVVEKINGERIKTVFAIASDGKLHALNLINGEDRFPPLQFVPPFSKPWSLNLVDGTLYTALSQGCNGGRSAVYAMDVKTADHPIAVFRAGPGGAGMWGRAGVAVSASGFVYAETGDGPWDPATGKYSDTVLKLSAKELKLADFYTPENRDWLSRKDLDMGSMSPAVFPFKGRELVAASGKEGVIYLLDAASMGGATHRQPLYRSPRYTNDEVQFAGRGFWGSFATWESAGGERWLYAPAWGPRSGKSPAFAIRNGPAPNGSIMAFKVEDNDGKATLAPVWISRDLNVPEPPIVANGIVYALSSGETTRQQGSDGHLLTSAERIAQHPGNAVLFALDAQTGEELYSSGKAIPGWSHFSGLAISYGRIYVTTFDSMVYQFSVPQ